VGVIRRISSNTPNNDLDMRVLNSDLVVGGALGAGYRSMCGLGKGVLAGGDSSLGNEWLRRLDAIDELLLSSQPRKTPLVTQESTVVEFSRFDDTSNPLRWIHHCECYFRFVEPQRTSASCTPPSTYLTVLNCGTIGSPDNNDLPTWEQFVLLVAVQFGPQFTGKPLNTPALGGDVTAAGGRQQRRTERR
jgi:hypothetical protein